MFRDTIIAENLIGPVSSADTMADTCNGCGICKKECAFLGTYGNPGAIVKQHKADPDNWRAVSFECSLCGLCTSVCPKGLDPSALFLDFRRKAVKKGQADLSKHQTLLNYEKRGMSKKYTLYSLPEHCDTVFFPGCTLTGTRPDSTLKTYAYLKEQIKTLGVVLDCCGKPSHDLGLQDNFNAMFSEMKSFLLENGITTILVACPNCHKMFNTHAKEFTLETVYDIMSRNGFDDNRTVSGSITIHDPCPVRLENTIQDSVRSVVRAKGLEIIDTPHRRKETFCCGEGGNVACVSPGFAAEWTKKSVTKVRPHKIVSYCAGCVNLLSKKADAFHVLDLVFDPERTLAGKTRVSRAPFTYLNRLRVKKSLKKFPAKTVRERTFNGPEQKKNTMGLKLFFAGIILAAMAEKAWSWASWVWQK